MIGIFNVKDTNDGHTYCICASEMNPAIEAKVYIPPLYRDSVSALKTQDKVFCVVDDASGFGAILFKFDDSVSKDNSLSLEHDLKVKENAEISGNCKIKGDCTVEGAYVGSGTVLFNDINKMFSALTITAPTGGGPCAVTPLSNMNIKFTKVMP